MKKANKIHLIVLLFLFSFTLTSCSGKSPKTDSMSRIVLVDNFNYDRYFQEISKDPYVVEGNWEYPKMNKEEKLPDYRFESEKEVKEILDDELAFIAWQDYHTEDFFDVGEYSFFVNTNVEAIPPSRYLETPKSVNFGIYFVLESSIYLIIIFSGFISL